MFDYRWIVNKILKGGNSCIHKNHEVICLCHKWGINVLKTKAWSIQ